MFIGVLLLLWSRDIKENKIGNYNFRICVCYKDYSGFLVNIQELPPHKKKNKKKQPLSINISKGNFLSYSLLHLSFGDRDL